MVKRVAKVVYLIQEVLQKMFPWPFLDGHGHFCMEIDDKNFSGFHVLLLVAWVCSSLISY